MLIKKLCNLYDRLDDVPMLGEKFTRVTYSLVLNRDGELIQVADLSDFGNGKSVLMITPSVGTRSNNAASKPNLCCDSFKYLLKDKYLESFKNLHQEIYNRCGNDKLLSVLKFLDSFNTQYLKEQVKDLKSNFVFEVEGEYVHELDDIKETWSNYYFENEIQKRPREICLITGQEDYIPKTHGQISDGSNGASLVSFNVSCAKSYNRDGMLNAPISYNVAHKYISALEWLLHNKQFIKIGDNRVFLWTDEKTDEEVILPGLFNITQNIDRDPKIDKTKELIHLVNA